MFVIRCNDQHKWMKSRTKNAHISRTSGTKKWRNSLENSVILVNERETFFRFAYIHVIGTRYISEPSNKLKILLQNIFVLFYRVPLPRLKVDLLYLGKENIRMLFFLFLFLPFLRCSFRWIYFNLVFLTPTDECVYWCFILRCLLALPNIEFNMINVCMSFSMGIDDKIAIQAEWASCCSAILMNDLTIHWMREYTFWLSAHIVPHQMCNQYKIHENERKQHFENIVFAKWILLSWSIDEALELGSLCLKEHFFSCVPGNFCISRDEIN